MHATELLAPSMKAALAARLERQPDAVALHFRPSGESYQTWTWRQLCDQINAVGRALASLGLQPGDRVASWSANRVEWIVCDLAMQCLGMVHVPIHRPVSPQQAAAQVQHSDAKVVWVEEPSQAAALRERLPSDVAVVCFQGPCDLDRNVWSSGELLAGSKAPGPSDAWTSWPAPEAEQLATILYTSGTTGEPKGVMLSHENLLFNASQMERQFGSYSGHRRMALLPLSHIFARTCDLYVWVLGQGELALAQSRETVCEDCAAIDPHVLNAVPYFFQKLQRQVEQGASLPSLLGKEIQFCCAGGAPLAPETYDFFAAHGLPLLQGYGLTESSPVISACDPDHDRRGSVGKPLAETEVRIQEGEIQVRGRHVMQGYFKDPTATSLALDGDWLRTGDVGHLDDDGYLFVTGRRKEMIVLSTGKNVAPTLIESLLVADPWFEQVLVLGDQRSSLAALIVLSEEGKQATKGREEELALATIARRLHGLSHHEQVRRCAILPRPFSLETGELTAKLSLRRDVIEQRWRERIDRLYDEPTFGQVNASSAQSPGEVSE